MNIKELKKQLKREKENYYDKDKLKRYFHIFVNQPDIKLYKVVRDAKIYRYYKENHKKIFQKIKMIIYARKVNRNSLKYSVELYGEFGKNLKVCHAPILVNGYSKMGDNVILHGMNCIGAKHLIDDAPTIGNNVEIGVGACIIGKVTIADGIKIAANSVVTTSFLEPNIVIGGVPARKIK